MPVSTSHSRVQFAELRAGAGTIPIFDDNLATNWIAGLRIQKNNDGTFIYIAGRPYRYDNSTSYQNYDYIIDNWLNYIPVSIDDETSAGSVSTYNLFQNYPNPFNPGTRISYSIPEAGLVTLKVYDILGREVQTLVNEHQAANNYSIDFNADELPSGIYFYKIFSGSYSETKKMLLLK